MAAFASLILCPAAGRSAAGKAPKVLSCSVSCPFLPSRRTLTSSRRSKFADASTSASARSARIESASATAMVESKGWRGHRAMLSPTPAVPRASLRRAARGGREGCLGFLRNRRKGRHVMHREVGKYLAIDGQLRLAQPIDQSAVRHAAQARRRVDACDPERPELALFLAPAAIGILTRLDDGLLGRAEYFAPGIEITLRLLEDFLVTSTRDDTAFDSCHILLTPVILSEGKHGFDATDIGLVHAHFAAQLTLTLAGFLRQNMTTVGLTTLEAIRCFAKTLRRGLLGFHLRHVRLLIF